MNYHKDDTPWSGTGATPASMRTHFAGHDGADGIRREGGRTAFDGDLGRTGPHDAEIAMILVAMKVLTAIIAGLFMAVGFYPIISLVVSIVVWKMLDQITDPQHLVDEIRRAIRGAD